MEISREDKKAEAVERMRKWGIYPPIINQFVEKDVVCESAPPLGACYWLNDEQKKRVAEFENKFNALVYHVIHTYAEFGELENYLYVSDYKEEWGSDRADIKEECQLVYVNNLDAPFCSEFGSIGIKLTPAAGLLRFW